MSYRRFLILDDDADVGQTIQWIAESLGFSAEYVTHAADFFEKIDLTLPDIITVDLAMPGLDGVEVMQLLAERNCTAKIIVSSGMGSRVLDAAQRSASEHGLNIVGVISKPVSKDALRAVVGEGSEVSQTPLTGGLPMRRDEFEVTSSSLRTAIDRHEFVVAYQPKVKCSDGAPAGFEALARWNHPERGIIMPDRFISIAEDNGLIDALTAQIFEQSLAWFSHAFAHGDLQLSVNISAKSLATLGLVDFLSDLCSRFRVAPARIVLELTETSAMVDPILSLDLMTRFRVRGFNLSIDDFGTGYSSMVQLVRLPFSEIKVDKSFVMRSQHSKEARAVIKSIIDLGHSLGLLVTAEGIEDRKAFDNVKSMGCDLAQGYLFARPMSGTATCDWTAGRHRETVYP